MDCHQIQTMAGAGMSNITSLRGDPVPSGDTANADLVERLEGLLECAKSGALIGMAWCGHYRDGALQAEWSHQPGQADRLSTGIMILSRDFTEAWVE